MSSVGGGGGTPKVDDSAANLGECDSDSDNGKGIQKHGNVTDIICEWSLK